MQKQKLIVAFLVLAASAAQADPRDDALSAMLRCTGINEIQARLACYDSAVGSVRGAILAPSSQPVPQHALGPATATASAAVPPPAAPPPRRKSGTSRFLSSIFGDGSPARPPQTTVQQFGSESIAAHGDRAYPGHRVGDTIDAISARLISYSFTGNARLLVSLDNGQDWIETGGSNLIGHLSHPALYYSARIDRNSGGSYALSLTGIARPIEVRRLR